MFPYPRFQNLHLDSFIARISTVYKPDIILSLFHLIAYRLSEKDATIHRLDIGIAPIRACYACSPIEIWRIFEPFFQRFRNAGATRERIKDGIRGTCKGDNITRSKKHSVAPGCLPYTIAPEFSKLFSLPSLSPSPSISIGRVNDTRITLNAPVSLLPFIRPR